MFQSGKCRLAQNVELSDEAEYGVVAAAGGLVAGQAVEDTEVGQHRKGEADSRAPFYFTRTRQIYSEEYRIKTACCIRTNMFCITCSAPRSLAYVPHIVGSSISPASQLQQHTLK